MSACGTLRAESGESAGGAASGETAEQHAGIASGEPERGQEREQEQRARDVVGFAEQDLVKFRRYIKEPYGMVLVTGPTGSGTMP